MVRVFREAVLPYVAWCAAALVLAVGACAPTKGFEPPPQRNGVTSVLSLARQVGADLGAEHNRDVGELRREYLRRISVDGPGSVAMELRTIRQVLSEYLTAQGVRDRKGDEQLLAAIKARGSGGRFWAVRGTLLGNEEVPRVSANNAPWSGTLEQVLNQIGTIIGDEVTQTDMVLTQMNAYVATLPSVLTDPTELGTAVTLSEVADSSRMYWQLEAEAVYQDYMHQARNWQSVRAWAVAGSFAAAMAF